MDGHQIIAPLSSYFTAIEEPTSGNIECSMFARLVVEEMVEVGESRVDAVGLFC